ncbi:hypothetical protein PFLA_a3135 [Pseudoalteromonas flavipulchra NCIMB 2033 = ATCC BAA-314]|nr:hypothetical protein [Pseudoalteromonas flavipulchra NCIMB 2033 = ATCC BAA-314]
MASKWQLVALVKRKPETCMPLCHLTIYQLDIDLAKRE